MGYTMVFTNDLFTAANGVYSKQKLEARDLGKNGLAFYNALFMILPLSLVAGWLGHWQLVGENWDERLGGTSEKEAKSVSRKE